MISGVPTLAHQAGSLPDLRSRARSVRRATVRMAHSGKTAHVASALSCADILVALYFHVMTLDEDRFILAKGHGCMSWYATLAQRGYFDEALLQTYAQNGSALAEHPSPGCIPGVDVGTGSLGHGLSIGAGMALARKVDARPGRVFVLLSDGECNEGSVWEAALFATARRLDNLVAIVDYNKLQAMGRSDEVAALAPLGRKWQSFGWGVREVDGHDMASLVGALEAVPFGRGRPNVVVAHTVKGKGVSFMEDDLEWHYRPPSADDLRRALAELED
ncbi:MAG TPA: transketolase [Myxococcales bacterium]|nr:transketolase [Myxococcales bacterium]